MVKRIIFICICLAAVAACSTSSHTATSKTQNNNYKKDPNTIHPQFVVFHLNDTVSELHFCINSKELLYTRQDGINFTTNVLISYKLLATYDAKDIVDSASMRLIDINNDVTDKLIMGKINIHARSPRSYYLRVTVSDLNRGISSINTVAVEKDNDLNRQNFMVRSVAGDAPLFRNYIHTGEELKVTYKAKIGVSIYVRYYNRDFPLAPPPFSLAEAKQFQYKADSVFSLPMSADGSFLFSAMKKGFYHFQLDTSRREGVTLFCFDENFPMIRKAQDMVPPLRYITSREEYDELTAAANKKAAVEKFWINCTGSTDRAKEVIRKYYNRVQDANTYFSSYVEGWKTDRGMIYLIYGAPTVIYRTANSETWIYGEENNLNALQYFFSKVNNPFTDNDYSLERSQTFKQSWYVAVDVWRQGRTYLQD